MRTRTGRLVPRVPWTKREGRLSDGLHKSKMLERENIHTDIYIYMYTIYISIYHIIYI
jgi:hypothetical protein